MKNDNTTNSTFVSVIIPVRNRDDVIGRTLLALEQQAYDLLKFQVIVVNDGSTDETGTILNDFQEHTRLDLTVIESKNMGPGTARNLGMEKACGDLVLFLDSDTIPDADLINRHVAMHDKVDGPACIMGPVHMSPQLVQSDQFRLFDTQLPMNSPGIQKVDWALFRAANTSMNLSALHSVGGFDQKLLAAEDTELAYRLDCKGVPIYFSDSPVCIHHHPMDIDGYMKKGWSYGQAVGVWYSKAPQVRHELVSRYGVTAPELTTFRKIKHALRTLFINRYTVKLLINLGKSIRTVWLQGSERLLKSAFRYNTRQAFYHTIQTTNRMAVSRT